ncbi:hypothetical protein GGR55DRAFT_675446 [Xylaria sp. FL0064]|nr:hypothetical protein GGR55DRAFT_675446 [Xylaria sp. FL0064]
MPSSSEYSSSGEEAEGFFGLSGQWPNAGAKSIAKLEERAEEDRRASKEFQQSLKLTLGDPVSNYRLHLWVNRFQRFRSATLKVDRKTTPTPAQVERFVLVVTDYMQSTTERTAISYATVQNFTYLIEEWAVFYFEDFKIQRRDRARIRSLLQGLLNDGTLTKEPVRDKHWVVTDAVQIMIQTLLQDAIKNGTPSWDIVIMRAVELLLQASCGCRAGEIRRSVLYTGREFLAWKHIVIWQTTKDGHDILKATITLAFVKGNKDSSARNREIVLSELSEPSLNCLCPVKLLLIHALRTGAVPQTSWIELKNYISRNKKKTVKWLYPERPVICGAAAGPYTLDPDKPADASRAMDGGITRDYVGRNLNDPGEPRVLARLPGEGKHQLHFTELPINQKRLKVEEVTLECERQGADPNRTADRKRIAKLMRRNQTEDWRTRTGEELEAVLSSEDDPETAPALDDPGSSSHTTTEPLEAGDIPVDPQLLEIEKLSSTLSINDLKELPDVLAAQIPDPSMEEGVGVADILDAPPDEFVTVLSTINIYRWSKTIDGLPPWAQSGGSRNSPSRFQYPCTKESCNQQFNLPRVRDAHSLNCDRAERPFRCVECESRFHKKSDLDCHVATVHKYTSADQQSVGSKVATIPPRDQ